MKVIKEKRNCGKTTKMIELLRADPKAVLLVCTSQEARRIAEEMCPQNPEEFRCRIMSWGYYFNYPRITTEVHLLIDNVDLFLQEKFIFQIEAVSINED